LVLTGDQPIPVPATHGQPARRRILSAPTYEWRSGQRYLSHWHGGHRHRGKRAGRIPCASPSGIVNRSLSAWANVRTLVPDDLRAPSLDRRRPAQTALKGNWFGNILRVGRGRSCSIPTRLGSSDSDELYGVPVMTPSIVYAAPICSDGGRSTTLLIGVAMPTAFASAPAVMIRLRLFGGRSEATWTNPNGRPGVIEDRVDRRN